MPSRITPLISGHYYHIYNRGVNKRHIFLNKRDYIRATNLIRFYNYIDYPIRFSKFLLLAKDERKEIWDRLKPSKTYTDILAYCLMPNHFHMLLKQNEENGISKFIANFQNSYTKYFNIKNDRIGPLFQGQFKAKKIDSEDQLIHVARYIHLNPFSSAIVKNIDKLLIYEWSSFPEYLNHSKYELCNKNLLLTYFNNSISFKKFILDNSEYQKRLEEIKHLTLD